MKPNHPSKMTILIVSLVFSLVGVGLSVLLHGRVSVLVEYAPVSLSVPAAIVFLMWLDARMQ